MKEKTEFRATEKISSSTLDSEMRKNKMNKNTLSKLGKTYDDNHAFKGYVVPTQMGKTPRSWFSRSVPHNAGKFTRRDYLNGASKKGYSVTLENAGSKFPTIVYTPINDGRDAFKEAIKKGERMYAEMRIQGEG